MKTDCDVLIVGAGPVGMTLAVELQRFGLSCRIVDQCAKPTDKSKALVVWPRTLELLDRAGIADNFVAAGMWAKGGADVRRRKTTRPHTSSSRRYGLPRSVDDRAKRDRATTE